MALRGGAGRSRLADGRQAGAEAASAALASARAERAAFAIVYATVLHDQAAVLAGVRSVLGDVPTVGGSTQGVSTVGAVEEVDRVVGVGIVEASPRVVARAAYVQGLGADAGGAGKRLAEALGGTAGTCPAILWYDPLTGVNVTQLLAGLASGGFDLVIGGAAGQPWGTMHATFQYCGQEVLSDAAVALVLSGDVRMVWDLTHGTEPLGVELEITASEGNVVQTIDGEPALDVWQQSLGGVRSNDVDATASWALGVQLPKDVATHYEGLITRAVFGFRDDTRELVLQAEIAKGTHVQLCHRTPKAVYDRAVAMADRIAARMGGKQGILALSFECGARPRPFLGDEQATAEVIAMQARLHGTPWLGTYCWGEIAPIGTRSYFHNYTFPLGVLVEEG